jgi:hypothetical protein
MMFRVVFWDTLPCRTKNFLPGIISQKTTLNIVPGVLSRRKAQPEREADHSTPTSADVKNEWELYILCTYAAAWL